MLSSPSSNRVLPLTFLPLFSDSSNLANKAYVQYFIIPVPISNLSQVSTLSRTFPHFPVLPSNFSRTSLLLFFPLNLPLAVI